VDTRSKIVTPEQLPRPIALVTGYFDVLSLDHIRALDEMMFSSPHFPIVVLVLQSAREFVSQRDRARMVAALRMVDYVLIADHEDPDVILERLRPAVVVRLEAADRRSNRRLIEHVQRGQTL
jgi:bifunctional ADP-heptose synthase (sugar kinase/adenylyltransferase)